MARSGTTSAQVNQGDITPVGYIDSNGVLVVASAAAPMPTSATLEGGGDASAAKQDAQTDLLTTIDSDTSRLTSSAGPLDAGSALATTAFMVGGKYDATPPTLTDGQQASVLLTSAGNLLTSFGVGMSVNMNIDVDESEDDVKTSAGVLLGYYFANLHASSLRYLRFYNATAANTTVGTTAAIMCLPLPALSAGHVWLGEGIPFSTALCVAATTGVAANDTGAPGANEVVVNTFYR